MLSYEYLRLLCWAQEEEEEAGSNLLIPVLSAFTLIFAFALLGQESVVLKLAPYDC